MYHHFYGFHESPFNMTPSSKYFFESAKHAEARNAMLYAIQERKGFVVITGDIGSGKTTVCRSLINQLDMDTKSALITNTHINAKDLLCAVMEDLEIDYTMGSKTKLLSQLNAYLIEELRHDHNVVLIIDEAQNLKPAVLEEIRMLSNLETEDEKLLQIIIMGQPELKEKLALKRLEQLRQRIALYYHLTPLSRKETYAYVNHRLKLASGSDRPYFTEAALFAIFKYARGVPRLINQIADSALLNGFVYNKEIIDEGLMQEVIKESPMKMIEGSHFKTKIRSWS